MVGLIVLAVRIPAVLPFASISILPASCNNQLLCVHSVYYCAFDQQLPHKATAPPLPPLKFSILTSKNWGFLYLHPLSFTVSNYWAHKPLLLLVQGILEYVQLCPVVAECGGCVCFLHCGRKCFKETAYQHGFFVYPTVIHGT